MGPREKTYTVDEETVEVIEILENCENYSDLDDDFITDYLSDEDYY